MSKSRTMGAMSTHEHDEYNENNSNSLVGFAWIYTRISEQFGRSGRPRVTLRKEAAAQDAPRGLCFAWLLISAKWHSAINYYKYRITVIKYNELNYNFKRYVYQNKKH